MSSTNKTEHYNLPQFIGSDIPTWLGDFNSAMTAIDSGINAAATAASGAATDAKAALNRCPFPIGYGGFFQSDPNSIYEGTNWEQKRDVFILASGDTYGAGSSGGEATHKLTIEEMPAHGHAVVPLNAKGGTNGTFVVNNPYVAMSAADTINISDGNKFYARNTSIEGGLKAHNNMPPYFAMPFWIRTA